MNKSYRAFTKLEFKLLLREPITLLFMIVVPVVLTIVFGGAFGADETQYGDLVIGIDTVTPVNIVFLLANVGLMGIPITITELKEQEVLKRYETYPTSFTCYFLSLVTAFSMVSIISTILFSTIAFLYYDANWHMTIADVLGLAIFYIFMTIVFNCLGFLIALLIKNSRVTNIATSGIFLTLIFTSGVVMPVDDLPVYIQKIADIFPMHHFIRVVQMLWISQFNILELKSHLIYILAISTICLIILRKVKIRWE